MKVLHVLSSHIFSGAENVVCQIIKMTKDIPDMQMIYCSPDGTIRPALEEREVQYIPLSKMSLIEIKRVIDDQNPDIVHAHDMKACVISALACGKTPLICHVHNNGMDTHALTPKTISFLFPAHKAKHIFWVSESSFLGYCYHDRFKEKSSILENIIDLEELYQKLKADENSYSYDIVFIGRLVYQKNPQRFVKLIQELSESKPDIKACILGTGEEKLEACSNIDILGFISNPVKLIHDAKLMLMTSRWEGTPMSALEAMAVGTPIISTPVDGMKVLIENDINGYLSDDDEQLKAYALKVMNDSNLRKKLSNNQLKKAAQINDMDSYRKEILKAYEECINS